MNKSLIVLAAVALSACGGSNSGGGSASGGADPQGLYLGTLENPSAGTNDLMWLLIDANHQAVMVDTSSGDIYRFSSFSVSGDSFSGAYTSYTFTTTSSGLSSTTTITPGSGNAGASYAPQSTVSGYLASSSSSVPAYSFDGTYEQSQYDSTAAFATIAATYTFKVGSTSYSLGVTQFGGFTITYGSCYGSGTLSIPDASYNAYELSGSINCSGTMEKITGLAYYTAAAGSTPAELTLEYDNGSNSAVQAVAQQ
jgi:hypothetical protein